MAGASLTLPHSESYRRKGASMIYKNKKTGAVIDVRSEMRGDWEPVKTENQAPKKAPKKTEAKKK